MNANESKNETPKYMLDVTGHVEFILSQAEEWARENKVDAKAVVDEARGGVVEMLDEWLEQQISRSSHNGSLLDFLDGYDFDECPEFYDDHFGLIAAHDGEIYNGGWAQGDNFITSKTSVGILHTEVDPEGNVTHLWLPYVGSVFACGFSAGITEPIPAEFPVQPEAPGGEDFDNETEF